MQKKRLYEIIRDEIEIYRKFLITEHSEERSKELLLFTPPIVPAARYNFLDSNSIFWINDLERDAKYSSWPSSISEVPFILFLILLFHLFLLLLFYSIF